MIFVSNFQCAAKDKRNNTGKQKDSKMPLTFRQRLLELHINGRHRKLKKYLVKVKIILFHLWACFHTHYF